MQDNVQALSLYPNPADEEVRLSFQSADAGNYSIKVYDILGKNILNEGGISKAGRNEHLINIKSLSKGIYVVAFENNDYSGRVKLEVE